MPAFRHRLTTTGRLLLWLACLLSVGACEPAVTPPDGSTPDVWGEAPSPERGAPEPATDAPDAPAPPDTRPDARSSPDARPEPAPDAAPAERPPPEPRREPTQEPSAERTPPDSAPERPILDEGGRSQSPLTASISQATDVVTSYLLSGSSWNYFHGKTVKLGRHSNVGNTSYFTAFRFQNIDIPQGATITKAHISWMPHNEVDSSHRLSINIYAEKAGNSAPYDPKNYSKGRPDQRLKTSAKIDRWIVRCRDDCSSDVKSPKYEYDCPQRKRDCWNRKTRYQCPKDLKAILEEVFAQPTWKRGQALSVFLFNAATDRDGAKYKDSRTLLGYDPTIPASAPQLTIHFTP